MLSPLSDRLEISAIEVDLLIDPFSSYPDWAVQVDTDKVFQLIDRILPFEACLYHQILPLEIKEGRLHLGMVMLEDTVALDYVRRLVGYMNYTLAPQSLSSETHYSTLTAYLNYAQNRPSEPLIPETPAEIVEPKAANFHEKATLVLDTSDELDWQEIYQSETHFQQSATPEAMPGNALPILEINPQPNPAAVSTLETLPPSALLQELLGQILTDGIGRLYLERQSDRGRILWSQNGILQSMIDTLSIEQFQGLLDELKALTHLPIEPIQQVTQVEIERLCQKNRVLLRLRIMPTAFGEEATLQVLRGAALKFYQRQQLSRLSRDALSIAKKLQNKVQEIHDRTQSETAIDHLQPEIVPTIDQVLQIVEQQLTDLKRLRGESNCE